MLLFGSHPSDAGGIDMAVRRAAAAGLRAVQVFSAKPQFYNEKIRIRADRVGRFTTALRETGLEARHVLVHAAYVLNTASPEPPKAARSREALARELERTASLGAFACCFHPGSAGTGDVAAAIERVAEAIVHAVETVPGSARVLVENTAGAGHTVGRSADEVAAILAHVPSALRERTGYGLDTCHLFASGHEIVASEQAMRDVLDRFEEQCGEKPAFFHLNDSEFAFGSNRDRHALIGEGQIGEPPFRWLLADARALGVPLILETPSANPPPADDDAAPDENDVRMRELLERLAPR
ncbi:MAG TPA: deoxyribonuclease IV [Gemmatimonadaceae bacterium]|nr:deoxyribonuclease IV [Gemmatimonadaceae bacterium]